MTEPERLLAALAAQLPGLTGMPTGPLRPETRLEDIPGLDSLRLMDLLAAVETEFAVELDPRDLDALECLGDILTALGLALARAG